jgi:hypothetical protein
VNIAVQPREDEELGDLKGNMDAKKLTGMLIVVVLAVPIIATAPSGTLALIDAGLIGLLYVIRRRRLTPATAPFPGSARAGIKAVAMP